MSIKLASKGKTNFDLSSNHITTTDFGQLQVSNIIPVVPNDSISASIFSEARFAPLVVPTFMDCDMVTRSYYVPMSSIYQPFEHFYTDKQDSTAFKTMPTITNADIVQIFCTGDSPYTENALGEAKPDFVAYHDTEPHDRPLVLTEKGRILLKLIQSLGYGINWTMQDTASFSLLPLIAFARICYDYIYPAQYLDGLGITKYFKISSNSDLSDCFGNYAKKRAFIDKIAVLLTLPYKQDYFTAAWKDINRPGSSSQNVTFNYLNNRTQIKNEGEYGVNYKYTQADGTDNVNTYQQGLNLLSRLYDFVTRNNIVGTRYADQIFARFGIGSRKSDPDMSQFLGQHIQPVNVVDVTAMSAAEGQDLGDLAGKAYLNGSGNLFDFESTDEFGYIISLTHIMPKIGYYQGRKRWTLSGDRFSFYQPEFDMQMRAIRNDELFADCKDGTAYTNGLSYGGSPGNTFGFAPNYSEYKKGDDYITGDFRNDSLNTNLEPYYLFRDITQPSSSHTLALNSDFLFCQQHEFDKIFAQPYTLRANMVLSENSALLPTEKLLVNDGEIVVFTNATESTWLDPEVLSNKYYIVIVDETDKMYLREIDLNSMYAYGINNENGDGGYWRLADNYVVGANTYYRFWFNNHWLFLHDATGVWSTSHSLQDSSWTHPLGIQTTYETGKELYPTYTEFIAIWQDYIDHIYLRHHFDIKANRSMVPISEEFMIEDGGATVSVDINGNRN